MGKLIYATSMSLDGYVADAAGDFMWAKPSDEVFASHVERMASVSTEILGRKTYELMTYWESAPVDHTWSDAEHEFARLWQGIDRVVASSTLSEVDLSAAKVQLVSSLTVERVQDIVDAAAGYVEIFGPTVAAAAIRAGLVEEFYLYVVPHVVGRGLAALPDGAHLPLELIEHREFDCGTVLLRYGRN